MADVGHSAGETECVDWMVAGLLSLNQALVALALVAKTRRRVVLCGRHVKAQMGHIDFGHLGMKETSCLVPLHCHWIGSHFLVGCQG